jgi:hypothetical protein
MQLVIQRRPDGQTEIVAAGRSFLIRTDPPEVAIPKMLLQDLRLSKLPDQIGVQPLGINLATAAGTQVDCWLYGFRDGYASVRIKIVEQGGPSPRLVALREAAHKRQDERGDVEVDELYEVDGKATFSFLVDLIEDMLVQQAFERIDQVVRELEKDGAAVLASVELEGSRRAKQAAARNL